MTSEESKIAEVVRKYGWYAANVFDSNPPFVYTIGLMQTWDHPELIIFGLESRSAHSIMSVMVESIRAGESYRQPGAYSGILEGDFQVGVRRVHSTQHPPYLGYAMGYARFIGRSGQLQAMQVCWPDQAGKFPYEAGCDLGVFQRQPRP